MNLTQATLRSDNTVYAQLDLDLGPKAVRETAKLMGITTKLDGYPAEGLGGLRLGVSPLEMANAYATLAVGRHPQQARWRSRRSCSPTASPTTSASPSGKRVLTDGEAYEVTKILEQNVQAGTGTRREHRLPGGRQDRHHRQLQRRLVRRLHAQARDRRLGRLPERAGRDAQRARHRGGRRHLPGA